MACFSSAEQVTVSTTAPICWLLEGEEETLVVPGAAVPVDSAGQNEVYRASGSVLAHSLETGAEEVEAPGACRALRPLPRLRDSTACSSGPGADPAGTACRRRLRHGSPTILMWIRVFAWARVRCCCPARSCGAGLCWNRLSDRPNSMLTDCTVGDGVRINASQCEESVVKRAVRSALMPTCVPTAPWVRRARSVPLSS